MEELRALNEELGSPGVAKLLAAAKKKGIRAQSDAKQKEARDKRLWKQLETLKF